MKQVKRICTFLLVLVLTVNLAATAFADGSVSYDGNANEFIFEPGTKHSPTSLFENFQNVMPGDKLTEEIQIKNASSKKIKIKVWMRSLGAQEKTDEFLSQMTLTVEQKDKKNPLFSGPAHKAQLTDWAYLGTVYSGGKVTLNVTLEVPITMGNEYQNQIGYVDWEFKIEELPVDPSDPDNPKTGDDSRIFLYSSLTVVSLAALVILVPLRKRRKEQ